MEAPAPPKRLSDYKQQFIPNKVLKTFDTKTVQNYKDFAEKPSIGWKEFNEYEQIVSYLYELRRKNPKLVKVFSIGSTVEKRPLLVVRISLPEGKTYDRIFVEGGIHANEWISLGAVLYFINRLITEWDTLPNYMRTKTWLILPLANPDGYIYAQADKESRMWRKNRNETRDPLCPGVDLNRNFSIGWDKNVSRDPCTNFYKGAQPFSERETRAIRDFLMPQKSYIKSYVSFHCYGQQIRYLWTYSTPIEGKERIAEVVKEATANVNSTTGKKKWKYKPLEKPTKDLYGLARDWARKDLNVQYSFTVELRDKGKKGFKLKPTLTMKTGTDVFSFMETIAKAISDDYNAVKQKFFITQDYHELLQGQSHLFKRRKQMLLK